MRAVRLAGTCAQSPCALQRAMCTARWSNAEVVGEGNQVMTTVATLARHTFAVDLPASEGGRGSAATPAQHLLGSLVGCQQVALHTAAAERKMALGTVRWAAEGKFGSQSAQAARTAPSLASVSATAQVDTPVSQAALDELQNEVLNRSLVASTLRAAGVEVRFNLRKEFTFKSSMGTYIDDLLHESRRGA